MKSTRTAALRCIYKVVIILLIITLSLTGCQGAKYENGTFGYLYWIKNCIMLGVRSNTNTFSINDVKLDFYCGIYNIDDGPEKEKSNYYAMNRENPFFVIYISEQTVAYRFKTHTSVEDYKNIEDYYLVREISEKEAFSNEYGYKMTFLFGIQYNHKEEILIPSRFFTKQKGYFYINVVTFLQPTSTEQNYLVTEINNIELYYEKIDSQIIEIKF